MVHRNEYKASVISYMYNPGEVYYEIIQYPSPSAFMSCPLEENGRQQECMYEYYEVNLTQPIDCNMVCYIYASL